MKKKWTSVALGAVVRIRGGGTPSKKVPSFWGGDIPWVSPKDMKSRNISSSIDSVTREALENSAAKLLPAGSVLIVVRSGILARTIPIAINDVELAINQDIKALCPEGPIISEYLRYCLEAREGEILKLVTRGATVHRLSTERLRSLELPLPPLAEQKRIVALLDEMSAETMRLQASYETKALLLSELKESLLKKAFAGALTANDAEQQAASA